MIEDKFGCQLVVAADKTYDDLISGNVRQHIERADFYIVDVTGANLNVMFELGAVHYGRPNSPTLLIAGLAKGKTSPDLPSDLQGQIACLYTQDNTQDEITQKLSDEFDKNQRLKHLLAAKDREDYVSVAKLKDAIGTIINLPDTVYAKLSERYPTTSDWSQASADDIAPLLGAAEDTATVVLTRVRKKLGG